jgi:hypothetical protein
MKHAVFEIGSYRPGRYMVFVYSNYREGDTHNDVYDAGLFCGSYPKRDVRDFLNNKPKAMALNIPKRIKWADIEKDADVDSKGNYKSFIFLSDGTMKEIKQRHHHSVNYALQKSGNLPTFPKVFSRKVAIEHKKTVGRVNTFE